jgi:3-deoxy-D-manno-octulosonic-acid transferase
VSLGEVVAVAPLVRQLHLRYPSARLICSTVTETGREAVEQRLAGVAEHRYAPLDFPWVVEHMLDSIRPSLYLFVETELWPNMLRALRRRAIPSILVNGRLSTRSFERQRLAGIRAFYRTMLRMVDACLMQSERDAQRIIELGADQTRVRCTGNIKFDQPMPTAGSTGVGISKAGLGIGEQERLFLAGSTHPGEEEIIAAAYRALSGEFPDLVLILAPRHIERAGQVAEMLRATGLTVFRRSQGEGRMPGTGPRAMVLDSRGELALLYRDAAVSFVGGTLVPIGGHNLLEPSAWGRPVLFGPHTDHCAEVAGLLLEAGGGRTVRSAEDLTEAVRLLLRNPGEAQRMGRAAQEMVVKNQGALQRTLDVITTYLPSRPGEPEIPRAAALELSSRQVS